MLDHVSFLAGSVDIALSDWAGYVILGAAVFGLVIVGLFDFQLAQKEEATRWQKLKLFGR